MNMKTTILFQTNLRHKKCILNLDSLLKDVPRTGPTIRKLLLVNLKNFVLRMAYIDKGKPGSVYHESIQISRVSV